MVAVKRIVLDILKPHHPNALEFAQALAAAGDDCHVKLTVLEMDENTETLEVEVSGPALDFERIQAAISEQGGSLHSIDLVEVDGNPASWPRE